MSILDFLFAHTKIAENCNRIICVFKTNFLMLLLLSFLFIQLQDK
jgi:hypothetical protein